MRNQTIRLGVVLLAALLAGIACGGDGTPPANITPVDDLPIGTAPPRPRTTAPRLPPGLSFEVEIPETADLSFSILVRVRDGDTVVPIAEVPEVAWPVAVRFMHEDPAVENARFELSPSSGGMRWTASASLSDRGRWRSVLELRGLSEPAGSIEIARAVVQPPEPVVIRAGAATVARGAPEIDWGVVREIAEGEELLVWVRLDDRRQEWLGVSDTGFPIGEWVLEESLALEERPVLRMQSSYGAALGSVFVGEVELRASPSLDSEVVGEAIDWVEAVGIDPSGEWILARPQLSTGIRFGWLEAAIFGSAKDSLPVALPPGVWLAESRADGGLELAAPESVLHPGTAEWLPADSVIPCDSVVTSEFETADGLRLFTNGCGLHPGPGGALFARLEVSETEDGSIELLDAEGIVVAAAAVGPWPNQPYARRTALIWSPDGEALAVHDLGDKSIQILRPGAATVAAGTESARYEAGRAFWDPGGALWFIAEAGVIRMSADGATTLVSTIPDHREAVVAGAGEVVIYHPGNREILLYDLESRESTSLGSGLGPARSPSGRYVTYLGSPDDSVERGFGEDAGGTIFYEVGVGTVGIAEANVVGAFWSPDERFLASVHPLLRNEGGAVGRWAIFSVDGSLVRIVGRVPSQFFPVWTPDGSILALAVFPVVG